MIRKEITEQISEQYQHRTELEKPGAAHTNAVSNKRNKYRQMHSQVAEQIAEPKRKPKKKPLKPTDAIIRRALESNFVNYGADDSQILQEDANKAADIQYKTPEELLQHITTTINCQSDLMLYEIERAVSNEFMSLVGLKILSGQLQKAYGDKKYLIRCYHQDIKFFEMPMDEMPKCLSVLHTNIAWIMHGNVNKIYVMDVGGVQRDGRSFGLYPKRKPMQRPYVISHTFFEDGTKFQSFILSYYNEVLKCIILTEKEACIIPFTLDEEENKKNPDFYQKQRQKIPITNFDFEDPTINQGITDLEKDVNDDDDTESQNFLEKDVTITKFLDHSVNRKLQKSRDEEQDIVEAILCKDQYNRIHLFRSKQQGRKFALYASIILKERQLGAAQSTTTVEVIDGVLISTSKVMLLIKVCLYINKNGLQGGTGKEDDLTDLQCLITQYSLQIWEVQKDNDIKKTLTFEISEKYINDCLTNWRENIVLDINNNAFYIPEYKENEESLQQMKRINIENNESGNIDPFNLSIFHVFDFVGHHVRYSEKQGQSIDGIIYTDIVVSDNLLYLSHGRFITIVDLNNIKDRSQHQHLAPKIFNDKAIDYYEMDRDVKAILMLDSPAIAVENRWKMIAVYNSGHILSFQEFPPEIEEVKEDNVPRSSNLRLRQPKKDIQIVPFLKDESSEGWKLEPKIEGKIVKVLRNSSNIQGASPFFVVKQENEYILYTIQQDKLYLKQYKLPNLDEKSAIILLQNTIEGNDYENIMVVNHNKIDEKQQEVAQIVKKYRLINTGIEGRSDIQQSLIPIREDLLDHNSRLISEAMEIFVDGDYLYLQYPKLVVKYNYVTNTFEEEATTIDNTYYYWRSYKKNDFYIPYDSNIFFEACENLTELKQKAQRSIYSIFDGIYPHLNQIYHDSLNDQIAAFTDYNQIVVFPLLHKNTIKLKNPGKRSSDVQIIASQMFHNKLYTIHNDNTIRSWSMKTGKFLQMKKINTIQKGNDIQNETTIDFSNYKWEVYFPPRYKEAARNLSDLDNIDLKNQESLLRLAEVRNLGSFYQRSSMKQKGSRKDQLYADFGIQGFDQNIVGFAQYKIIEIIDAQVEEKQNFMAQKTVDRLLVNDSSVCGNFENMKVKEIMSFDGPCLIENRNNFGLFVSDDLQIIAFNYKDTQKVIQTCYYKARTYSNLTNSTSIYINKDWLNNGNPISNNTNVNLEFVCAAEPNTWISTFSSDFKYRLKLDKKFELLELAYYNQSKQNLSQDQLDNIAKISAKIQQLNEQSLGAAPSFIAADKICFMSEDNVILGYQISDQARIEGENLVPVKSQKKKQKKKVTRQIFNVAQCKFPGSDGVIQMDTLFLQDDILIGENIMLLQLQPKTIDPSRFTEIVAPNYFNHFLQQQAYREEDADDAFEMKYIQTHWKTKIELMPGMYTGYIYQSKDFGSEESYQTEIHIVNTFNFYQWRALSLLKKQKLLVDYISKEQLQNLCFCQTPQGKTILHYIKLNQDSIKQLFAKVYDKNQDTEPFYVPILPDEKGRSVLHSILESKKLMNQNHDNHENQKSLRSSAALEILQSIGDYPFDLFKLRIGKIIDNIIDVDIAKFAQFLESKIKTPSMLPQIKYCKVKDREINILTTDELWNLDVKDIRSQIEFAREDLKRVETRVLDIHMNSIFQNWNLNSPNISLIFEKLAQTDSIQVFSYSSIRALIEMKWKYIKLRVFLFLLVPYFGFMICLLLYTLYDLEYYDTNVEDNLVEMATPLRVLVWMFTAYFFVSEMRQLMVSGIAYFRNSWNFMDIAIISLIATAEGLQGRFQVNDPKIVGDSDYNDRAKVVRTLYSITVIIAWIRFLYFFRIFKTTGYYIKMLQEVIKDIRYFIFVFLLTIFAFTHAWFVFLKNNSTGSTLDSYDGGALAYVYNLSLGDFDTSVFGDYETRISWAFFVLATFLLQIVLLNLLISIVADTFQRIKDDYNIIMYQDMLNLINENQFLAFGKLHEEMRRKYLIMVIPITEQDEQEILVKHLEFIGASIRDQSNKHLEMQKKFQQLQKVEEKQTLILEKIDKMDQRQKHFLDFISKITQQGKSR